MVHTHLTVIPEGVHFKGNKFFSCFEATLSGQYHAIIIMEIMMTMMGIRDVPGDHFGCFFEHCSKGGGGSNPCSKILEQILYNF